MIDAHLTHRAWVFCTRERVENNFYFAEEFIDGHISQNSPCKKRLSVFGETDIVVPIEADSINAIHDQLMLLTQAGSGISDTQTLIAAYPDFTNQDRYSGHKAVVCFSTTSVNREVVYKSLKRLPAFSVVDIIFGSYDIIGLLAAKPEYTADDYSKIIRKITDGKIGEHITKTVTMIPHLISSDI